MLNSDCKSKGDVELAAGEPQSELNRKLLALFLDEDDKVSVHSVMAQLKRNGIRPFSDPRLVQMVNKLPRLTEGNVFCATLANGGECVLCYPG